MEWQQPACNVHSVSGVMWGDSKLSCLMPGWVLRRARTIQTCSGTATTRVALLTPKECGCVCDCYTGLVLGVVRYTWLQPIMDGLGVSKEEKGCVHRKVLKRKDTFLGHGRMPYDLGSCGWGGISNEVDIWEGGGGGMYRHQSARINQSPQLPP
jgi:hypothetical protein